MKPQSKQDVSSYKDQDVSSYKHPMLQKAPEGLSVRFVKISLPGQISHWLEPDTPLFLLHPIYKVKTLDYHFKDFLSWWSEEWV